MRAKHTKNQSGFTIVELLMATVVFSIVLLIVTTGIIKIGQTYYKGLVQARTQETARAISEDIVRSIQLAKGQKVPGPDPTKQFCIGTTRYTYVIDEKIGDPGVTGLVSEKVPPNDCSAAGSNSRQLLAQNMRLLFFSVEPVDDLAQSWNVNLRVASGDSDLLSHYDSRSQPVAGDRAELTKNAVCKSGISGGSFCATAQLDSTIKKRLKNE